jgi:hypothetical protein
LKYAEEHPDEVLDVIEDKTEALIRDLEQRQRATAETFRTKRRSPLRGVEQISDVPF